MTQRQILLAEQTITQEDLRELIQWLETNPWLTQGPLVREFEDQWSCWLGTRYTTYVNSGSSADLLMYSALLASGRLKNKRVVVPAVSWATTVAPAIQLGFEPIMCEADWHTFGVDLNHLEDLLKQHGPAAVIVVHVLGVPNDMEGLLDLKERYGFMLMEDACASTGSRYDGRPVGTFGDLSAFSAFYGHHISTIEGGMVCTSDEELHDLLLHLRSHGWAKDVARDKEERQARAHGALEFNRPFTFYYPGFNFRSTDLNARIGLSQLKRINNVVERRIENHKIYQSRFLDAGFHCQTTQRGTICSISFSALADSMEHRERIGAALRAHDIETRPLGGGNMSRQPFWADRYGSAVFPVADRIHTTSFQLPNHPRLTPEDIDFVCGVVLSVPRETAAAPLAAGTRGV
ncbi:MAG: DegT/DnrJ/EryC1/StrS family aminotransferase [bacterium]